MSYATYAQFQQRYSAQAVSQLVPDAPDSVQQIVEDALVAASFQIDLKLNVQVSVPVDSDAASAGFLSWLRDAAIVIAAHNLATDWGGRGVKGLEGRFNRLMTDLGRIESGDLLVPNATGVLRTKKRIAMAKTTEDDEAKLQSSYWNRQRAFAGEA